VSDYSEFWSLKGIGERIVSEDNRATEHPIYVVTQKQEIPGVDPAFSFDYHVWTQDGEEVEEEIATLLDGLEKAGGSIPIMYEKIYCREIDEWVQPFLTEAGAESYIAANRHNLRKPFVYVHSAYRNPEWQEIRREALKAAEVPS
jgi:hypothetical protein